MKDDVKSQLTKILGAYDEKLAETARVEAAARAAQEAFPGRFAALKSETVRPVLEEFVTLLNARGHEVTVVEQEPSSSNSGGVVTAAISLHVIPKPFAHRPTQAKNSFLEITFSANREVRKIAVSSTNTLMNSGGSRGKRGEYEVEAVTADVVTSHVVQTLQEAFGG